MTDAAIRTIGLTKRYGRVTVLDALDLTVERGEVLGYLGPNGAGKTTTIRLLLGLARPSAGRAEVFGRDCTADALGVHRRLAYIPGGAGLWPNLTGAETLHLLGRVHGRVDTAYRDELIERFALDPATKVRAYSTGNRQKVLLVAALMTRADLLVFDEPTGGLDPIMEQAFRDCVREARERGQTVLLSSHLLGEVESVCDRVAILRTGRLVEIATLAELRRLSSVTIELTVDGVVPDLERVPGVAGVVRDGPRIRLHLTGPIGPLLDALRGCEVRRLLSREPSLQELFLARYGPAGDVPGAADPAAGPVAPRARVGSRA